MSPRILAALLCCLLTALSTHAQCLTPGQTVTGTLGSTETNAYCFTATNGTFLTLAMGGSDTQPASLHLLGPSGEILAGFTNYTLLKADNLRLTNSGQYTVLCSSHEVGGFDYTLTLILNPAENDGSIASGETKTRILGYGDLDAFYFIAESNQVASISMGAEGGTPFAFELFGPDGARINTFGGDYATYVPGLVLPASGRYMILCRSDWWVAPVSFGYNLTLILHSAENDGPIASGETRGKHLDLGDLDAYYFFAESNQTASITSAIEWGGFIGFELLAPDGTRIAHAVGGSGTAVSGLRLPASGRYTILCVNGADYPISFDYNLTLLLHPAENDGLIAFGQTRSATLTFGDMDGYYFDGASGRKVTILAGILGPAAVLELHSPDGSMVFSRLINGMTNLTDFALPASGRYMIVCRNVEYSFYPQVPLFYGITLLACPGENQTDPEDEPIQPGVISSATMNIGDLDTFDFMAGKGDSFTVTLVCEDTPSSPVMSATLYHGCTPVASAEGASVRFPMACVAEGGRYTVVCRSLDGITAFPYTVSLQQSSMPAVPPSDPDPYLVIVRCDTSILLRWLANTPGFKLQSTDTLGNDSWSNVLETPSLDGDTYSLSVLPTAPKRFYRLASD